MISLLIVTFNESHRIADALKSARRFVDEIVLVDQASTDGTAEIARGLADIVLIDPHYGFCERSRPRAAAAASGDWFLVLDADEWIDYPESDVLRGLAAEPLDGYFLWRASDIDGKRVADEQIFRFFRRDAVIFREELHTSPEPVPGARRAYSPYPPIRHTKTREEFALDDARYRAMKYVRPSEDALPVVDSAPLAGPAPRIALVVVPPCATHPDSTLERHRRYVDEVVVFDRTGDASDAWSGVEADWILFLNEGEHLDYPDETVLRRLVGAGRLDGYYLWRATDRAEARVADEKVFRLFKRGCAALTDPHARSLELHAIPGTRYAFVPFPIVRRELHPSRTG